MQVGSRGREFQIYMVKEEDSSEKEFDDDEILPEHMRGVELDFYGVFPLVMWPFLLELVN